MSDLLKDRIDVLIEKSRSGDSNAQLKLAKCFQKGYLVEKSIDQARYWAFKSVSNGNTLAQNYYHEIDKNTKGGIRDYVRVFLALFSMLPYVELVLGIIILIFTGIFGFDDSIVNTIAANGFLLGLISIFSSIFLGKLCENKIHYEESYYVGASIGIFITHIIAIVILL